MSIAPIPSMIKPKTARQKYIEEHFPEVEIGGKPLGPMVLIQLRSVKPKTRGGIELPSETVEFNANQTALGIIRAIGPLAFRNRETMQEWPEGIWADVGDIVMVKRHEGDRFQRSIPGTDEKAIFILLHDHFIRWKVDDSFQRIEEVYENII